MKTLIGIVVGLVVLGAVYFGIINNKGKTSDDIDSETPSENTEKQSGNENKGLNGKPLVTDSEINSKSKFDVCSKLSAEEISSLTGITLEGPKYVSGVDTISNCGFTRIKDEASVISLQSIDSSKSSDAEIDDYVKSSRSTIEKSGYYKVETKQISGLGNNTFTFNVGSPMNISGITFVKNRIFITINVVGQKDGSSMAIKLAQIVASKIN